PWRSLEKINAFPFEPGDRIQFRAGSFWPGPLIISAQGTKRQPVIFESEGVQNRPRIDGADAIEDAVVISNAQHVIFRGFELTNAGTNSTRPRRAVHIIGDNAGTLTNIVVSDLYIHDVNGTQKRKENGGIVFTTRGERVPTRFDGLRIERNIVWRVDRSGIVAQSYHARRNRWFPSVHVVIRDNWLGDIGGDGITPWATDGCLVEHNILEGANERAGTYNAGIWPWSTDNTVMRLNCVSGVKTLMDGQGFDSDYNCHNTLIEFNLSHDNQGGFLLICSPGNRNLKENCGNVGTIARYNISRNDGARTFHVSAVEHTLVEHNAIYVARDADVQVLLLSDWSGWAEDLDIRNNLFWSDGLARYGHQQTRSPNGSYGLAPGWGPARNIAFEGNRYVGKHADPPSEALSTGKAPEPIQFDDWPGPQFDPRQPDTFDHYIKAHRAWMVCLMKRQFGRRP
ncbi:MAG: right-handed parallel beta-helix repeat-containing protein, partial [Limisphaerales bacterium]